MAKAHPSSPGEPSIASFESSLKELEAIVQSMEAGEAPLEAALASYERGVALVRQCQETLAAVERKLQVLDNGALRDIDLVDSNGPEGQ